MSRSTRHWSASTLAVLALSGGCATEEDLTETPGDEANLPPGTAARPTTIFIADVDPNNVEVTGTCTLTQTRSGELKWKMTVSDHPFASGWFAIYDVTTDSILYTVDISGPARQRSGNQVISAQDVATLSGHELQCRIYETFPMILWAAGETTFLVP